MKKRFLAGFMVLTMILSGSMSAMAAEPSVPTEITSEDNSTVQTEDEVKEEPEEDQTTEETGETGEIENETVEDEIEESGEEKSEIETGEDGTDGIGTDGIEAEETDTEVGEEEAEIEEEEAEIEEEEAEIVDAEEAILFDDQEPIETVYVLNPIYANEYTTENLITYIAEQKASDTAKTYNATVYDAVSVADAANYVKSTMKVRGTECTIKTAQANGYKEIFQTALIDNISTASNEGDYLRANWLGYELTYYIIGDSVVYMYNITYVDNAEQEAAVTNMIPGVLNSLNLSGKTEFEKIKIIHDYVCRQITYTDDGSLLCHSTYAALVNGKAVCQGYASLFYRLCREAGISTRFITGKGGGGDHAWNIVRIGNYYYNLDATWDDDDRYGDIYYDYFLKSDADFGDHVRNADPRDNMDYSSDAFYAEYPMSPVSYGGTELDQTNLSKNFTTIDGRTVNSTAAGKPKVLIFFSTICGNSSYTINAISNSNWIGSGIADVVAVDINRHTKDEVTAFNNSYGCNDIDFCYDTGIDANLAGWDYINLCGAGSTLPVIIYIDADNNIRGFTNGAQSAAGVKSHIDSMGASSTESYSITAGAGIGGKISPNGIKVVLPGENVTYQITPDRGYGIADVKVDNVSVGAKSSYTFSNITTSHTITASFAPVSADNPFNDVPESEWYADAVKWAYKNNIMNGKGNGSFDPIGTTTRAENVQVLYNILGRPNVSFDNRFADVTSGDWYANAVSWAVQKNITTGVSATKFAPAQEVSRQEVAVFLYRFAKLRGYNTSGRNDLSSYSDSNQISSWAMEAMQWANNAGIINGNGAGKLNPLGNATRAEIATMMKNFYTKYN